jgi:hypothetical protein
VPKATVLVSRISSCTSPKASTSTHWLGSSPRRAALRHRPRRLRRAPGVSHFATVTQPRASSAPSSRPPTTHHGAAPAPAFPPWWILLSRCETGHCTVVSFGSEAGSTDSRDVFAPHDLRNQHSPQPVALALRNKRYKINSCSK